MPFETFGQVTLEGQTIKWSYQAIPCTSVHGFQNNFNVFIEE